MKIVIAGNWLWPQYESAFAAGLQNLGHEVLPFSVAVFFEGLFGKQQNALPVPGPALLRLNSALIRFLRKEKPSVLVAWRCTHLLPSTIKEINKIGILTVSYNNDDPFGPTTHCNAPWHHRYLWHWYLKGLKFYKLNFFYRLLNVVEAKRLGVDHAEVLMPYFIPHQNRPVTLTQAEELVYGCDAVFIGHYEPDERVKHLRALVESGVSVKLFGGGYWSSEVLGELYPYFAPLVPVIDDEYAKALCGAKVCLAFISKLNRDTYTRRCFEIPACGRVMLAERTDDLLNMFEEDKEACFFSSSEELVMKVKWLLGDPETAKKIALAGLQRVWNDGHDVNSRAAEFMDSITNFNSEVVFRNNH